MALTNYCEFDEVRAALGVNDLELSDAVLSLPVYEIGLIRELTKISSSLPAAFSSINDKDEASRTSAEEDLLSATHLFCVYAVARQAGVPLPMMAPKDIGDGKATLSRFSGEPFTAVLSGIDAAYNAAKTDLRASLDAYGTTITATKATVPITGFARAQRVTDPVTGA